MSQSTFVSKPSMEVLQINDDPSRLNTHGLIRHSINPEILAQTTEAYLDTLETSAAIYEKNGDYALGIFSSSWCKLLNDASRKLAGTENLEDALRSGKWLCHESCWQISKAAIDTGEPQDAPCHGGIRIFACPIQLQNHTIGAINFGYGDPPKDSKTLQEIAEKYQLDINELQESANSYSSRSPRTITIAKSSFHPRPCSLQKSCAGARLNRYSRSAKSSTVRLSKHLRT